MNNDRLCRATSFDIPGYPCLNLSWLRTLASLRQYHTDCPGSVNVFIIIINPSLQSSTRNWINYQQLTMFLLCFILCYFLRSLDQLNTGWGEVSTVVGTEQTVWSCAVQHSTGSPIITSQASADSVSSLYCKQIKFQLFMLISTDASSGAPLINPRKNGPVVKLLTVYNESD